MKQPVRFLLSAAVCLHLATTARAGQRQLLSGHLPPAPAVATALRPLKADTTLDLAISLPLRNREALTNLLDQLYDPASPNFRRFLTADQFAAQFGPTAADYQAVMAFAAGNGLKVTRTYGNRALVDVRGTAHAINNAFHLTITEYQRPGSSETFYAPDGEPSLDLATPVLNVSGLDNYAPPKALYHLKSENFGSPGPQPLAGSNPSGYYWGYDFRRAYVPGVTLDGAGQSVALVEFDGYYPGDIISYENSTGVTKVPLTNIFINTTGIPGRQTVEVSLDIEMAASMAPGLSNIMVYEGVNAHDVLNQMAVDNAAKQMSTSWTFAPDSSLAQIYMQFGTQGQAMFQASGDADAYVGAPPLPTDMPYLTCVGGTYLNMSGSGASYLNEVVWNRGGGVGTGGGISTTYLLPTWQQGIDMTAKGGSTKFRNSPDVAMIADNIYTIGQNQQAIVLGGTSCAAPLWAAFTALANELAASNGMPVIGFANPALYAIAKGTGYSATFHDTTSGNNESASSPARFSAAAGYDLCTGWGSPTGSNLLAAIALPEPLIVLPLVPPPMAGPAGGPFTPGSVTFTLANGGAASLNWVLTNTSPYFDVSPTNGSLSPHTTASVVITPKASDAALPTGSYVSSFIFADLTDQYLQTRSATLLVPTPPLIQSQPTNLNLLEGQTAVFSVRAATNAQLGYQWWKTNGSANVAMVDSTNIAGSTTASLTISTVSPNDAASYYVVVSNAAGVTTSSNAVLTIIPSAPALAILPTNLTVLPGAVATFSVAAIGTHPFTYQWTFHGTNLVNSGNVYGANTSSLTISNITSDWDGAFTAVVGNSLGTNSASATLFVQPVTASNATLTLVSSFTTATGINPVGGMATNKNVPIAYYGVTLQGGANGYGSFYKIFASGSTVGVHSFAAGDANYSYSSLVFDRNGTYFYGLSSAGGASNFGTIFRINPSGQYLTIKSFTGVDGNQPYSDLFQAQDNNFYGTTAYGGYFGLGNIFRISTAGIFSNLVSFDGVTGSNPTGAFVQDSSGNMYNTAEMGGFYGLGTVYQLTPSKQLRVWVDFDGATGSEPSAGLTMDAQGNLYGTTFAGGPYDAGEVFKIYPDGTGYVIYQFTGGDDGGSPLGAMALGADGNLYGTTTVGGQFDLGSIFVITPDGVLTTLASFDGYQGSNPSSVMLQYQNSWYGVAPLGGVNNIGTSYRLTVTGPLQITEQPADQVVDIGGTGSFEVATLGAGPVSYQWRKNGTNILDGSGVTGSAARILTISGVSSSNAGVYSVVVSNSFGAATSSPALLQILISTPVITQQPLDQTVLLGAVAQFTVKAAGDYPLSYQWFQNGVPLTNSSRITGATNATLTLNSATNLDSGVYYVVVYDDLFYQQSSNANLLVTPIVAQGYTYQNFESFSSRTGANPYAALIQTRDGFLYGTASAGGSAAAGTIFSMTTNGNFGSDYVFTGGNDGAGVFAGLLQGSGTNSALYGVTARGGSDSYGTMFQITTNKVFTLLHTFTGGTDGASPEGTLVSGPDGTLYGTSASGGDLGGGTLFSATTSGALTTLYSFFGFSDGATPLCGPVFASDGYLYGTTYLGGTNDYGSIYKTDTSGNLITLHSFDGFDGANPVASLVQGLDGRLYGTAFQGGDNGLGSVFAISTNGDFTNIYFFNYDQGALPAAGLTLAPDGSFYGTVQNGGPGGGGGVYRITPAGLWTPVIWFNGQNGAMPQSPPILATDGYYYGTAYWGGTNNLGSIYRFKAPPAPQITAQPADIVTNLGAAATFAVTATTTTPITYQWFFNNVAIANATNSALTITNVALTNAGLYYVALANSGGATNSRAALLTVVSPLVQNGGFETGDFTGWSLSGNTLNLAVQGDPTSVHTGLFGAHAAPAGSLGYLTETSATTPGAAYRLSFWLNSPDGATPNEVDVLWNSQSIFDETNVPATGWINLQFEVIAPGASSAVSIGLRNDTSYFALDDVSLTPLPTLQSNLVSQTPGQPPQVAFQWSATPGLRYQAQYKDSLDITTWSNLGPVITAGATPISVNDFLTNSQRFYRILLLP